VPSEANAGGAISVDFEVINQSTTVATHTPHWTDSVYLSTKSTLDNTAILLKSFPNQSALGPGGNYQTHATTLIIPDRFTGSGYLIVAADSDKSVDETPQEDDNTDVSPITIHARPPADLVAGGVSAPDQAFDGNSVSVSFTVSNKGLNVTNVSSWTDTIWLA